MFTRKQLEFIKASLTAQGAMLPVSDGGQSARTFISVVDEIDKQLERLPALESVKADGKP